MSKVIRALAGLQDDRGLHAPGTVIDYYDDKTASQLVKEGVAEWAKVIPEEKQLLGDREAIIELLVKKGKVTKELATTIVETWEIDKVDDLFALSVPELVSGIKGFDPVSAEEMLKRLKK